MALSREETAAQLQGASGGFDHLFSNQLTEARAQFAAEETPFHLIGLGVCSFLEAALGMETNLMAEAKGTLERAEAGSRKQLKAATARGVKGTTRFGPGMEWEVLHADSVILAGMVNVLSESYMGYLQCLYALNSAHSKFTKLYKSVFPNGLDAYSTPDPSRSPSRAPSINSLAPTPSGSPSSKPASPRSFFSRIGSSISLAPPATPMPDTGPLPDDGPVEEAIISGVAFGFGLFNLVFSLLPGSVKRIVGWLGFQHDRRLALRALAVSAEKSDVHAVFAGLSLMTYHGVVLLLAGYQADEQHILRQYRAIVDKLSGRYPTGSLWILNRAKILRMSHDAEAAIRVLQEGLAPERPHVFRQADALLVFELAWTLLAQRRYKESADMFIRMTEVNQWSQSTYYFIAGGCHIALRDYDTAQKLLDQVPILLEKKKIGGKDLPTEVLIRKKMTFYKEKQKRRGGDEARYAECIRLSPAEELAIFWNTHQRIDPAVAEAHVAEWTALTPALPAALSLPSAPSEATGPLDLDTPDELALRLLLLGIVLCTLRQYAQARACLAEARGMHGEVKVNGWIAGVAMFEAAVLELKEAEWELEKRPDREARAEEEKVARWKDVLADAGTKLDEALTLAPNSVDLSSRLESRVAMLRDELVLKREMLGL